MERLNAEAMVPMVMEGLAGLADDIEGALGDERSSKPFVLVATDEAEVGFIAEANSPKPLDALLILRRACGGGAEVFDTAGFGGGFGPASKNLPPLSGAGVSCGAAGEDL